MICFLLSFVVWSFYWKVFCIIIIKIYFELVPSVFIFFGPILFNGFFVELDRCADRLFLVKNAYGFKWDATEEVPTTFFGPSVASVGFVQRDGRWFDFFKSLVHCVEMDEKPYFGSPGIKSFHELVVT